MVPHVWRSALPATVALARAFVGSRGGAITWAGDREFGIHDGGRMAGG